MSTVKILPTTPYQQALAPLPADDPAWVRGLRQASQSRLESLGMPGRGNEAYKYINLGALLSQPFKTHADTLDAPVDVALVNAHLLPESAESRLVFVNGVFRADLSAIKAGGNLAALNLAAVLGDERCGEKLAITLGQPEEDAFALVNATQFRDGAFVHVMPGQRPETLVQVLFLTTDEREAAFVTYPRSVFIVESGAKLNLLIQTVGNPSGIHAAGTYFTNAVQHFVLGEGAEVDCEYVQNEAPEAWQMAASRVQLARDAKFSLTTLTFGGKTVRHGIEVTLDGERAECQLDGLNVLQGRSEAYHYTVIDHAQPHCVSRQYYKGILDDASKSSFNGVIVVRPGAQRTDSQQMNKNLMLSDDARAYTRPQLQISADDVKCAHGATVGQLDEDQMFYLASRGIGEDVARDILTYGFAEEIIQRLNYPSLRAYLDRCLFANLRNDGGRSLEKCAARSKFEP